MRYLRHLICLIFAILSFGTAPTFAQLNIKSKEIDSYLRQMLVKSNVPGFAVAVVSKDSVIFSKGYGVNGRGKAITSNSPFAIASLSKAFTALAVMQLAEQGKIDIDDPVSKYIPTFKLDDPRGAKMTVRQVLNQVSGLNDRAFPELSFKKQPENLDKAIERFHNVKLSDNPGSKFSYHNPNYQILAKVVEAVAKQPFNTYLEANIVQPLRMSKTTAVTSTKALNQTFPDFANGHIFAFGKAISIQEPDWFIEGAAGMVSTVDDLAKWLQLQLRHGKLADATLVDSTTLQITHTAPAGKPYGMGWFAGKDSTISHSGILWTYSAEQIITKNGYAVVMLFNGGINAFEDYHAFIRGVTDILENKKPEIPSVPGWVFPVVLDLALIIGICFAIRRLFRNEYWYKNFQKRKHWQSWTLIFLRLIPSILLASLPYLLTSVSGRVLSWERIFLMMPDVLTLFGIVAVVNLAVVLGRVTRIRKFPFSV